MPRPSAPHAGGAVQASPGRLAVFLAALVPLLAAVPATASAQEPVAADSLARRLRALETRIDSLESELARLRERRGAPAGARDTAENALAALRAAAAEAAPDTAPGGGESRTRSLTELNPEISITGDVLATATEPHEGEGSLGAVPRSVELSIQSALDPYSRAKVFIGRHEEVEIAGRPAPGHAHGGEDDGGGGDAQAESEDHGGFELEEGYLYWVGLPGGLGAKAGKFRQQIGLYNRWHSHALLEVDRPLPVLAFLGEEGLAQTGLGTTLPSVTTGPGTQTAYLEVARGSNPTLFEGSGELSYLGRLESFWDLSAASFLQLGATGVYGENDGASLVTRLLELDVYYRWRPPARGLYRDFSARGEWYFVEKEEAGLPATAGGGYVQLNYRLDRSWILGARADYLDPFGDEPEVLQLAPSVTWWQSEWVRLRLQYNYVERADEPNHTFLLQSVWAVGPHKHETY